SRTLGSTSAGSAAFVPPAVSLAGSSLQVAAQPPATRHATASDMHIRLMDDLLCTASLGTTRNPRIPPRSLRRPFYPVGSRAVRNEIVTKRVGCAVHNPRWVVHRVTWCAQHTLRGYAVPSGDARKASR